jgi:hypothetical protein
MFSEFRWEVVVGIVYIDEITISREGTAYPSGVPEFIPGV